MGIVVVGLHVGLVVGGLHVGLVVGLHVGLGGLHIVLGGLHVGLGVHLGIFLQRGLFIQPSVLYAFMSAPISFVFWLLLFSSDESSMYCLHSSVTAKFGSALSTFSSSSGLLDSYAVTAAALVLLLAGHGLGVGQFVGFLVGHSNFRQFKGHDT